MGFSAVWTFLYSRHKSPWFPACLMDVSFGVKFAFLVWLSAFVELLQAVHKWGLYLGNGWAIIVGTLKKKG